MPAALDKAVAAVANSPMFELEKYIPYLLNRAGARVAAKFTQDMRPQDISLQEWRVLASLNYNGPQRMSDLADHTSIDRTTLSRLVSRMETSQLVSRTRAEEDGREVHIGLTEKGSGITEGIIPLAQRYEEIALEGFSADEAAAFRDMLRRVYTNFEKL